VRRTIDPNVTPLALFEMTKAWRTARDKEDGEALAYMRRTIEAWEDSKPECWNRRRRRQENFEQLTRAVRNGWFLPSVLEDYGK